jgi:hypothetical protein
MAGAMSRPVMALAPPSPYGAERLAEEAIRRALFPKPVTAVPSSRRLRLFPPSQIEEPHPERQPLDLDQGLLHRAPDDLPGASSDNLSGDAIAREAQEE